MNEYKGMQGGPRHARDHKEIGNLYRRDQKLNGRPNPKPEKEVRPLPKHMQVDGIKKLNEARFRYQDAQREKQRHEMPFSLRFRQIEPADFNFVLNAWMVSFRNSRRDLNNEVYFGGQQNLIAALAKRRRMVIACDGDEPVWIAGFVCGQILQGDKLLLDYVYVKQAYRNRGIGRGLLAAIGHNPTMDIIGTHRTHQVEGLWQKWRATYNNYFNHLGYSSV